MSYAIMRTEKRKAEDIFGMQRHNERQYTNHSNEDINKELTKNNYDLITPCKNYKIKIQEEIDKRFTGGVEEGKPIPKIRKDAVMCAEILFTSDSNFFEKIGEEREKIYFKKCLEFAQGRFGKENVISAKVHKDETTPHLHLVFIPLHSDGRLSMKKFIDGKKDMIKMQDDFFAHISKEFPELERGKSASETERKHLEVEEYKDKTNYLDKKIEKIKITKEEKEKTLTTYLAMNNIIETIEKTPIDKTSYFSKNKQKSIDCNLLDLMVEHLKHQRNLVIVNENQNKEIKQLKADNQKLFNQNRELDQTYKKLNTQITALIKDMDNPEKLKERAIMIIEQKRKLDEERRKKEKELKETIIIKERFVKAELEKAKEEKVENKKLKQLERLIKELEAGIKEYEETTNKKYPRETDKKIIEKELKEYEGKVIKQEEERLKEEEKNNKLEGTYKDYWDNGKIKFESNWKDDKLDGITKRYYESGELKSEEHWKDDELVGWIDYDESGNIIEKNNWKEVIETQRNKGNLTGSFRDGTATGLDIEYWDNGNIKSETTYKNANLEGIVKWYHENGNIQAEYNYENGKKEGISKKYYGNGNLEYEEHWKDDKLNGVVKSYYKNGQLEYEDNYKDDKLDGLSKTYYSNGNIQSESTYKDDKRNGVSKWYYEDGQLESEANYKAGVIVPLEKEEIKQEEKVETPVPDVEIKKSEITTSEVKTEEKSKPKRLTLAEQRKRGNQGNER